MTNVGIYSESFQQRKNAEHKSKPIHRGTKGLIRAILAIIPKHESIIDLGAGSGRHVRLLTSEGYHCMGIDGTPNVCQITEGWVEQRDLLYPLRDVGTWDWGLFYDVGEHVPREHEEKLIDNICSVPRKGLIISWGFPHERGRGHVNCRTQVHVACEFARRGFWADDELTQRARDASGFRQHYIRLFVAIRKSKW